MNKLFNLHLHPVVECSVTWELQVAVARMPDGGLYLQYLLGGDLSQILIPDLQAPVATDGLWEHTCFEMFIGVQGESGYREFNFSPSSQWAAYAFSGYRQRAEWTASCAPEVKFIPLFDDGSGGDGFLLDVFVDATDLPVSSDGKPLELGLSAVVETTTGEKSYWALKHSVERPDFHQRDSFTIVLR